MRQPTTGDQPMADSNDYLAQASDLVSRHMEAPCSPSASRRNLAADIAEIMAQRDGLADSLCEACRTGLNLEQYVAKHR